MAFPTDFRGGTMVQPDGSYKNTPIPARLRVGKKTKKRAGGNYKRHWSQVRARTSASKSTARKRG